MIIDVECPQCYGHGEVTSSSPSMRSRFVGRDDLSPDDFTEPCPRCLGRGVVDHDLNEDADG
jgi:DnaJ-class molecular chaperone